MSIRHSGYTTVNKIGSLLSKGVSILYEKTSITIEGDDLVILTYIQYIDSS